MLSRSNNKPVPFCRVHGRERARELCLLAPLYPGLLHERTTGNTIYPSHPYYLAIQARSLGASVLYGGLVSSKFPTTTVPLGLIEAAALSPGCRGIKSMVAYVAVFIVPSGLLCTWKA